MPGRDGLYRKYRVTRMDGEDRIGGRHDTCDLFVLDVTHDTAARLALATYIDASDHPQLKADLEAMLARVTDKETYR